MAGLRLLTQVWWQLPIFADDAFSTVLSVVEWEGSALGCLLKVNLKTFGSLLDVTVKTCHGFCARKAAGSAVESCSNVSRLVIFSSELENNRSDHHSVV